jgi:hypothetical protein
MNQIFKREKSLRDSSPFIGASIEGRSYWYWSHSGEIIDPRDFDFGVNQPDHPDTERCSNMFWQNNKISFNDVECRHKVNLNNFLCVDVLYVENSFLNNGI